MGRIDREAIFKRDGYVCQLCGMLVAMDRKAPHRLSPVVDHIKPRIKGGTDDPDNLQTAHWACNSSKSHRPEMGSGFDPLAETDGLSITLSACADPAPPEWPTDSDLPPVSPHRVGEIHDRVRELSEACLLRVIPTDEELLRWLKERKFEDEIDARDALNDMLEDFLIDHDDEANAELAAILMRELPEAWFLSCRRGSCGGPESLRDVSGWTELATNINELYDLWDIVDRVTDAAFSSEG